MFHQTSVIKVFYYGDARLTGYVLIETDLFKFLGDFSIPHLNDFFLRVRSFTRTFTFNLGRRNMFVVYDLDTGLGYQLQMIVFRRGATSRRLVNLRSTDEEFIMSAIERYVLIREEKKKAYSPNRSIVRRTLLNPLPIVTHLNRLIEVWTAHFPLF